MLKLERDLAAGESAPPGGQRRAATGRCFQPV